MSVSESLVAVSGVTSFRDVGSLDLRELRVELVEMKRLRSVVDGRLVDIVRRIEESTREVGTHERDIAETSMRGDVLSPNARWGACSGIGKFSAIVAASACSVPTSSYGHNPLVWLDDE